MQSIVSGKFYTLFYSLSPRGLALAATTAITTAAVDTAAPLHSERKIPCQ
jgi:hypothetical protein